MSKHEPLLLRQCARCGGDHIVTFRPLARPVQDADGALWTLWAPCPVSGEPILGRIDEGGPRETTQPHSDGAA
jgi:hypothetical protein